MNATLIQRIKRQYASGIVEIAIWKLPEPVMPCQHHYKYRLVYVVEGVRVVGYDNERGKGDHCHYRALESPYRFDSLENLLADFWADVEKGGQQ